MGWKFYGHAAVFGFPDKDRDVLAPGCFTEFLADPGHLSIPLCNGHDRSDVLGRWVRMHQDGFGLFVIGELNDDLPPLAPPFPGLSISPVRAQGSPFLNIWGGMLCRVTSLDEISLVSTPSNPATRVIGPW